MTLQAEGGPVDAAETKCGFAQGAILADRFEIERTLGTGGQGIVVLVRHRWLNRHLVLKIGKDTTERINRLLLREAQITARLCHPAVGDVIDAGYLEDGRAYIVSSWRDTENLELLAQRQPFSPTDALVIARRLLDGLIVLHAQDLLHLDIKPSNVLVPVRDNIPRIAEAYLIDLGVAATLHAGLNGQMRHARGGRLAGTPLFMAPEQLAGLPRVPASDIYGLGAMLFWLVLGETPLGSGGVQAYHFKDNGEDLTISVVTDRLLNDLNLVDNASLPAPFAALLTRWLRSAPETRPQTAELARAEVGEALSAMESLSDIVTTVE